MYIDMEENNSSRLFASDKLILITFSTFYFRTTTNFWPKKQVVHYGEKWLRVVLTRKSRSRYRYLSIQCIRYVQSIEVDYFKMQNLADKLGWLADMVKTLSNCLFGIYKVENIWMSWLEATLSRYWIFPILQGEELRELPTWLERRVLIFYWIRLFFALTHSDSHREQPHQPVWFHYNWKGT